MNGLVDEVLVLNLDRSRDRMRTVDAEMRRHNISYTRVSGVDGSKLTNAQRWQQSTPTCYYTCSAGTVGCFLSHIKCWRYVASRGLQRVVIFEDDVRLTDNYEGILGEALATLPEDYHLMFLGCFTCNTSHPIERAMKGLQGVRRQASEVGPHLVRPTQTLGTHAYMVSSAGADALLRLLPRASFHLDWEMSKLIDRLDVYAVKPDIAYQTDAASIIGSREPMLSNMLASHFKYSRDDEDVRTWAWTLSEPLLTLGRDDLTVDGWVLISLSFILLLPRHFALWFMCEVVCASVLNPRGLTSRYFLLVGLVLVLRLYAASRGEA